jgi:hypothetical protein
MRIRTRWPWITSLLSTALVFNPLGLDIVHNAFFSGEALARNIWGPIALTAFALFAFLILLEYVIRMLIWKRRARGATTV